MAAEVAELDASEVTTLLGQTLGVTIEGRRVMIGEAQVLIADIEASNGVMHVIDSVLLPSS